MRSKQVADTHDGAQPDMQTLWHEFHKTKSHELRQELILHYIYLVNHTAGRMMIHLGAHAEYDDLVGYGVFGLMDAVEKFDPFKGVKFETYANIRIRGAIIDAIRQMDWIPRTARQKNKQISEAIQKLEATLGREPTNKELSEHLGLDLEATNELLSKSGVFSLVSLDEYVDPGNETTYASLLADAEPSPDEMTLRREKMQLLASRIDKLPKKEKLVVSLHYFEGLTINEISSIMGVSKSRVSQIHTQALRHLESALGQYRELLFGAT